MDHKELILAAFSCVTTIQWADSSSLLIYQAARAEELALGPPLILRPPVFTESIGALPRRGESPPHPTWAHIQPS